MNIGLDSFIKNDRSYNYCNIALIIMGLSFVIVLLRYLCFNTYEDVGNYYKQFLFLKEGKVPYLDFTFEYPPLSLLFIVIPGIMSFDLTSFAFVYTLESTVFYLLCAFFLFKMAEERKCNNKVIAIILISAIILINTRILHRNDIFAIFFAIVAYYYYSRGNHTLAFIMLALGVMTKIFPIVFALAFVIPFFKYSWRDGIRKAGKYVVISVGICLATSLPWLIIDMGSAFDYLTYHAERGLQVESVSASIVSFINLFVPIAYPSTGYGSFNVSGDIPDLIAKILLPLMIIVLGIFTAWCIHNEYNVSKDNDFMKRFSLIFSIDIIIFVIFGKVFSEQYMIWFLLPVSIVLLCNLDAEDYVNVLLLALMSLIMSPIAVIVTGVSMNNIEPMGTLMILLRNILVIALAGYLLKILVECYKYSDSHT